MQFFSFREINERGSASVVAAELLGAKIGRDGRCAATWRGGDNPAAVSFDGPKWYDHVKKEGGSVLDLAMKAFPGDEIMARNRAQEWCGMRFNLTPTRRTVAVDTGHSRHATLIAEGFRETARYEYRDLSGSTKHITVRLEHPERKKEFVQGAPDCAGGIRWTVRGLDTYLYRLPEIATSPWVLLCEGEKSADRLAALGLPATTSPMGAGKWDDRYTAMLSGKKVVIAPDNDDPGREHARIVSSALVSAGIEVRIVGPLSSREKGGIDDWLDEADQPRTAQDVIAAIQQAAPVAQATPEDDDNGGKPVAPERLAAAKEANKEPFRNYTITEVEVIKRGKPTKEDSKTPRGSRAMREDAYRRLLGFPRRLGANMLFDYCRDSGDIVFLAHTSDVLAWMNSRINKPVGWVQGDGFLTKDEFVADLRREGKRYEQISSTPDWPRRQDTYYIHPPIPPPSLNHTAFARLIELFAPASVQDAALVRAMFASPIWHLRGISRPSWIIDSSGGQASGKTALVEMLAYLYGAPPIRTSPEELRYDVRELTGRLLSADGRTCRIVLVDNVTGEFHSPSLADLITQVNISGRAPYGRGEESRPNNLTYVLTANAAQVDSDLSGRSYYIMLRRPDYDPAWRTRALSYIDNNRLTIIADIIDILSRHTPFAGCRPVTRHPEFEQSILQPMCGSQESFTEALEHMLKIRSEANADEGIASALVEAIESGISEQGGDPAEECFLRSEWINLVCGKVLRDVRPSKDQPIQVVRSLAKSGHLPQAIDRIGFWPRSSKRKRFRGIGWRVTFETEFESRRIRVYHYRGEGKLEVTHE